MNNPVRTKEEIHGEMLPMRLQFFAEGTGDEGDSSAAGTGNEGSEGTGDQNQNKDGEPKTYTQEELTAIATKEKREGKSSVLKSLGFKDEKTAKAEMEAYTKWKAEHQSAEEKAAEELRITKENELEAKREAALVKEELAALKSGISADSIEDALAIARVKVTEEKNLDAVLTEMKAQAKYAGFFGSTAGSGTGSDVGHSNSSHTGANLGKALAEKNVSNVTKKSTYFSK